MKTVAAWWFWSFTYRGVQVDSLSLPLFATVIPGKRWQSVTPLLMDMWDNDGSTFDVPNFLLWQKSSSWPNGWIESDFPAPTPCVLCNRGLGGITSLAAIRTWPAIYALSDVAFRQIPSSSSCSWLFPSIVYNFRFPGSTWCKQSERMHPNAASCKRFGSCLVLGKFLRRIVVLCPTICSAFISFHSRRPNGACLSVSRQKLSFLVLSWSTREKSVTHRLLHTLHCCLLVIICWYLMYATKITYMMSAVSTLLL